MDSRPADLSIAQLDAILEFLSIFEQPGYSFGKWRSPEGEFSFWAASPEVAAFIQALHHEQFIWPFDWISWGAEAQRLTQGGAEALATADLTTLRKLVTS